MFLIDVTYPSGALDQAARQDIGGRIVDRLIIPGAAPAETLARARRMTHVVFREADAWVTGDGPADAQGPPPYLVTITVPEAWRAEIASHGMDAVRAALVGHDRRPDGSRRDGDLWINVIGVPDGSIGLDGSPTDAVGVVEFMTEDHRRTAPPAPDLPDGVVLDPVCGMRVRLGPDAVTLEDDGQVIGFCATGCRSAYARRRGLSSEER